jgi:hypothetical protein
VFDPGCDEHPGGVRWQVFRRVGRRGLVRVESTDADRVRSKQLRCWFRAVGDGCDTRVRIGVGPCGDELVPTAEEAAKEAEAAKEVALARANALEAALRRLKARQRRG